MTAEEFANNTMGVLKELEGLAFSPIVKVGLDINREVVSVVTADGDLFKLEVRKVRRLNEREESNEQKVAPVGSSN